MDEYISREALLAELTADYGKWISYNDTDESYRNGVRDNFADTINLVSKMPTADVQPVKYGRWIKHRIDDPKSILYGAVKDTTCSICGNSTPYNTECCMHCGARMDGDSE